ncbi:MAG: hypothetical protein RL769_538, partial [Pseudomonadota bacterium]
MEVKYFNQEVLNNISEEAKIIFNIFKNQVRLVGGSTRDLLLGLKAKDDDFASILNPALIAEILQKNRIKAVLTHQKYGTITAIINNKNIEITTLRIDNEQKGRRCEVDFIDDFAIDASRRDFSVNAIYMDYQGYIYDYFRGVEDLKNHKIRFIGDPNLRIQEDYLRILRFFRFSCEYAIQLDEQGLQACLRNKEGLKLLSIERITKEFFLLLSSKNNLKIIEILKLLKSEKILSSIINAEFEVDKIDYFFKNINFFSDYDQDYRLRIALIFSEVVLSDFTKFNEFFKKLKLNNQIYDYFFAIRNFLELFDKDNLFQDLKAFENNIINPNDYEKISKKFYYYLVFFKKDYLLDALILFTVKHKLPVVCFSNIAKMIKNINLPIFPLTGNDLLLLNFKGKE